MIDVAVDEVAMTPVGADGAAARAAEATVSGTAMPRAIAIAHPRQFTDASRACLASPATLDGLGNGHLRRV